MNFSQFDRDFDRQRRTFNFMFKGVGCLIAVIWIAVILAIIGLICLAVRGCKQVERKGLKAVITQVWDGPATNPPPAEGLK